MGLDIVVGGLAWAVGDGVDETRDEYVRRFANLNEFLGWAGKAQHHEPTTLPKEAMFEAQMWGYSGLHHIRRLAAHHALRGQLPPPSTGGSADPVTDQFYRRYHDYERRTLAPFPFNLLVRDRLPPFGHLMWHSDAEGFYLPQDFPRVLFDTAEPNYGVPGLMVGSAPHLLQECLTLAKLIDLPPDIDPEDDVLWENAEEPPTTGPLWHQFAVEAFGLARLIKACTLSMRYGAAVVFA